MFVKLYACEGNGCDSLNLSIEDPDAPENVSTLNGPSTPFTFQSYKKLNMKVMSESLGQKTFKLNLRSNNSDLLLGNEQKSNISRQITIQVETPEITWQVITNDGAKTFGYRGSPIIFKTRGEDFITRSNIYEAVADVNIKSDAINNAILTMNLETNKGCVKAVIFEKTNSEKCTVGDFLVNPNLIFKMDHNKKGWIMATIDEGTIRFMIKGPGHNISAKLPVVYFELKLEP